MLRTKVQTTRMQPRNRRTAVRISDLTRSVDKVVAAPKINPTENITSFGFLAGSGSRDQRATVTRVFGDNWEGLFVNDQLKEEGHSLRLGNVLEILADVGPYKYEELEANDATLEVFGSFPETLTQTRRDGII